MVKTTYGAVPWICYFSCKHIFYTDLRLIDQNTHFFRSTQSSLNIFFTHEKEILCFPRFCQRHTHIHKFFYILGNKTVRGVSAPFTTTLLLCEFFGSRTAADAAMMAFLSGIFCRNAVFSVYYIHTHIHSMRIFMCVCLCVCVKI